MQETNNAVMTAKPPKEKKKINWKKQGWLIIIPSALFLIIFMLYPMLSMLKLSFTDTATSTFTLSAYAKFFQSNVYFQVILLTLKVSFFVTLFTLLLGYPVAYVMTKCSRRGSALIMICVMIPFWTSLLVRTYSWMILLQSDGVLNSLLMKLHIISEPIQLLNNTTGVYIGMTHILIPYMILSLYPVMKGINTNVVDATRTLGASKIKAFIKVYFPLSIQGISAGCILVFVMGIGYFITPSLLGGTNDAMISQLIQVQVSKLLDWQFASAISVILLIVSLIILYVSRKVMKVDKLW